MRHSLIGLSILFGLAASSVACSSSDGSSSEASGGTGASLPGFEAGINTGGFGSVPSGGSGGASTGGSAGAAQGGSAGAGVVTFSSGVFALLAFGATANPELYTNPSVAGIAVRTEWATHEPTTEGTYDWTYLDQQVADAKAASKLISIYMAVGAPEWLYAAGAVPIELTSGNGKTKKVPVPWDPIFLEKWKQFIQAFGARYANEPTVAYVRGATESLTNGWALAATDSSGKPLTEYGYTSPETLLVPMKSVLDAMMQAFPHTPHWAEVGVVKDAPSFKVTSTAHFAEQIAVYGFSKYPDRFGVWREDLSGCTPIPPIRGDWQVLWDHKGKNGAQMVWNVQDGPDFRMDQCGNANPPDKPTVLDNAVQNGLTFGMPYLEIYGIDCLDPELATTLGAAAQNLN